MLQQLFGAELDLPVRLAISLIVIAALLGVTILVMRKLSGGMPGRASGRGRAGPRLAIVDAISIDPRRRLVLVRRDDVEHLVLTGGNNDVVVEQNITGSYVAAGGLRPAMPQERDAQRGAQAPAFRHPAAAQRAENTPLPPSPPRPDALAANAVAAALAAPVAEPPIEPQPTRPQVAPEAPPVVERAAARPVPAAAKAPAIVKELPPAPARPAQPAPAAPEEPQPPQSRLEELNAAMARSKAQLLSLRRRLSGTPDDQKQPTIDALKRVERRIPLLEREIARLKAEEQAAETPQAPAPQRPDQATQRGLAMLLGGDAERRATGAPTEVASDGVKPDAATLANQKAAAELAAAQKAEEEAAAEKAAAEKAVVRKAAAERAAAEKIAAERAAAEKAAVEKARAERAAAEKAATERAAAEKAAAEKARAEKVASERAAAQKAAAEKAAAERAAAEKAAAQRAAAEKAAAEKAAAERAAAEKAAAEKAATEKAVAERAAAEKAAADRAAAEKAAADKAAAEQELADRIAGEMAAALQEHETAAPQEPEKAPARSSYTPAGRQGGSERAAPSPAVEPRLREMAQRLDAALSRPADDSLRLSLSDLLEDIEGAASEVTVPAEPERPRLPLSPRQPVEPVVPRADPKARGVSPADYSRFISEEPSATPAPAATESAARSQAKELFADGWMRATRRTERTVEPPLAAPEVRGTRVSEPAAPAKREPFMAPRRTEAAPLVDVLPKMEPEVKAPVPEAVSPADADDTFLDEFDAEMATLLGRKPSR